MLGAIVIDLDIHIGIFDCIANPGHSGQVGNSLKFFRFKKRQHLSAFPNIGLYHPEVGIGVQSFFVGPFFARIVIIIKVVQTDDFIATPG